MLSTGYMKLRFRNVTKNFVREKSQLHFSRAENGTWDHNAKLLRMRSLNQRVSNKDIIKIYCRLKYKYD